MLRLSPDWASVRSQRPIGCNSDVGGHRLRRRRRRVRCGAAPARSLLCGLLRHRDAARGRVGASATHARARSRRGHRPARRHGPCRASGLRPDAGRRRAGDARHGAETLRRRSGHQLRGRRLRPSAPAGPVRPDRLGAVDPSLGTPGQAAPVRSGRDGVGPWRPVCQCRSGAGPDAGSRSPRPRALAGRGRRPGVGGCGDRRRRGAHDPRSLRDLETQLAWLRETGFADVDCAFKAWRFAVYGGRKPAG